MKRNDAEQIGEMIRKFVKNPKFEEEIRKQIGGSIDTSELDREYDGFENESEAFQIELTKYWTQYEAIMKLVGMIFGIA